MSIDVEKHRDRILAAFNDVVGDKKATDWALFGYEGQSNILKVVGTGEDGLEELAEDLNSSKIMYAVVKVEDPNTTRPKIILINWQGEGAPTVRKGTCARHLHDVHKLLRGIHVTVNARTEEEVEPEVVMAAVLKASATTYNFNERSEMSDKTTPVGTNYKRTNPLAEIDSRSRNKFWEEQEAEERRRKNEEQQRKDEELKRLENDRKKREISEAQQRENLTRERNARIAAERKAEDLAAQRMAAQQDKKWQSDMESQQREDEERSRRAEAMRLERKKEAEALIGNRTHATRNIFESAMSTSPSQHNDVDKNRPPPRRLKEFRPINTERENEKQSSSTGAPSRGVTARWPPAASESSPHQASTPTQHRGGVAVSSGINAVRTPVQDNIPAQSSPPAPPSKHPNEQDPVQMNGDKAAHTYKDPAIETFNQHNASQSGQVLNGTSSNKLTPNRTEEEYEPVIVDNDTTAASQPNATPSGVGMLYEVDGVEYQILPEHGLCARALYDYQAADDTEITFDPSEIITNIDQIDEGWWQGVGPDGMYGLFPANYVELINQASV